MNEMYKDNTVIKFEDNQVQMDHISTIEDSLDIHQHEEVPYIEGENIFRGNNFYE